MSYQDHHHPPMYDDFQSRHYSHRQTYHNPSPFHTRTHSHEPNSPSCYPLLDHVSGIQTVHRQSHGESNTSGPVWDDGRATNPYLQRPPADPRRITPHVELQDFLAPQAQPLDWPGFSGSSVDGAHAHPRLYSHYPTRTSEMDSFGGDGNVPRMTLAGSLDPSTGIFYRTPEHPRLRTAQACEKCRTRKAKCSGEHPSCKRCATRGLVCEYAKEGRVRGPNKPKIRPADSKEELTKTSSHDGTRGSPISDSNLDVTNEIIEERPLRHRNSGSLVEHRASRPRPPNLRSEASNLYLLQPAFRFNDHLPRKSLNNGQRKQRVHQQLTTTVPLNLQPRDALIFHQPTHDDTSTSSVGDAYAHVPAINLEQSTFSDQGSCSQSESGSTSNPTSAVSSAFDLSLMSPEPSILGTAVSAIGDYRGDGPDPYGSLHCIPLDATLQQHNIPTREYPESVSHFDGVPAT